MSKESIYNTAIGLIDAIEYVSRFEQRDITLQSAIDKLDSIGDYKDAKEIAKDCRARREKEIEKGTVAVMKKAVFRQNKAKTKSDYADAIENYNRVIKYDYKVDECKKGIAFCEKQIGNIETKLIWKRRFIALGVIAAMVGFIMITPIYPAIKGVIHQKRGEYTAAVNCYRSINGSLGTSKQMKKCYFYLGEEEYKSGNFVKALKYYKKAEDKLDAPKRACELEIYMLERAKPGDSVTFGTSKWSVLEHRLDGRLTLLCEDLGNKTAYDTGNAGSYIESSLCRKLNWQYLQNNFSTFEEEILVSQGEMQIPESEQEIDAESGKKITEMPVYFLLMSEKQYREYGEKKNYIKKAVVKGKSYWLSDCKNGEAYYVSSMERDTDIWKTDMKDKTIHSRPLCVVSLSQKAKE